MWKQLGGHWGQGPVHEQASGQPPLHSQIKPEFRGLQRTPGSQFKIYKAVLTRQVCKEYPHLLGRKTRREKTHL